MKKKKDCGTLLAELAVLVNVYAALKASVASPLTIQAAEDAINNRLAKVQ